MRAFTVLGPSQSGKSTLVEALAGLDGGKGRKLDMFGGVSATSFDFMGDPWVAFDVPGGTDSVARAGPALMVSDAAVLCVSADEDAAVLSAPYLRLLEESGVPTFVFLNRVDAATGRMADIVAALQAYCAHGIVLRQVPIRDGEEITGAVDLISERAWEYHEGARSSLMKLPDSMKTREEEARTELLESLADFDDHLLEELIEDHQPMTDEVYEIATRVLQHHDLVPALMGSASHGNGILRLMKSLRHEAPSVDVAAERIGASGSVVAGGAMADVVKHVGKTLLVRVLSGSLSQGGELGGNTIGSLVGLDARTPVSSVNAGEVALTVKSDHLTLGPVYTSSEAQEPPEWTSAHAPALHRIVRPVHEKDENRLSGALSRLTEIDTALVTSQDETTGHLVFGAQGPQHIKRLTDKLDADFGITVELSEIPPAYRETIRRGVEIHHRHRKQSGGAGQFADIVIDVKPGELGSGFAFSEEVKGGVVPKNYIPAVQHGAQDALAEGPSGFPVVDIAVNLKDGKSHSVDSSDFAFRTAGRNGVKEAFAEAGTRVLQPIMLVQVHVPSVFAGALVPLVSGMKGQVLGFEGHPSATGWDVFRTLLPMASEETLAQSLGSATRGTAWMQSELDHYEEVREPVSSGA